MARVVEREGQGAQGDQNQAAYALAVAARSYLLQNGVRHGACLQIADDTRHQRVGAQKPGPAALAAAWFTDGLILQGATVRNHQSRAETGTLGWEPTLAAARSGSSFGTLLARAWPQASLQGMGGAADCQRLPQSEQWLARLQQRWQGQLQRENGYETLAQLPQVCLLDYGNPYSDQRRLRMYVRATLGREERITLAHEYLHLAFRHHPRGLDENWLEARARRLVDGMPPV